MRYSLLYYFVCSWILDIPTGEGIRITVNVQCGNYEQNTWNAACVPCILAALTAMMEDFTSFSHVCLLVTNERLNKALTNWFGEEYTFTHWEYVGDSKCDGFHSEVIRIRLHGANKDGAQNSLQVVVKYMPRSISRKLTFRSHEFYKNEFNFYKIVLPGLISFQSTKNVKDPFTNYPKFVFAYSDGNNDVICLEDAEVEGFSLVAVRQECVDIEHCKATLKVFAKFHALSIAMKDQEPEKFEVLRNVIFETYYHDRLWEWYAKFWNRISGIAINAVETEYPNSIYVEKIKQFAVPERLQDIINAATRTETNGVISHGDSWINNFMYKYVDGQVVDAKLIDFQITRYANPVLDISSMIYSCTSQDLRNQYYDELLTFYHSTLSNQVKGLGSDPLKLYPWELFNEDIKKYSYLGLAFSFETVTFIELPPEDAINMETEGDQLLNISDVWRLGNIKSKEGRLRLANNIKHCVDRGYI